MNRNILTDFLLSAVLALSLSACKNSESLDSEVKQPELLDNYFFKLVGAYSEGIDFDNKNKRFVISSYNKGIVYTLGIDGKTLTPLSSLLQLLLQITCSVRFEFLSWVAFGYRQR